MPLNSINGYNDAFKAFTDFATQAKGGSTIAQISDEKNAVGGTGPLAGRTIVAKTGFDFIGNVGRRQESRREQRRARPLQAGHRGHVRRPRQDPGERPRRDEALRLRQGQAALRAAHPRRQDRGGPGGRQDKQLHRGEQGPFRIHQGRQGGGRQEDRYGFRRLQRQRRRHGHREGQHPPAHGQHAVEPPPGGGRAEKGGPAARQPERTQGGFEEQSRDIRGRQENAGGNGRLPSQGNDREACPNRQRRPSQGVREALRRLVRHGHPQGRHADAQDHQDGDEFLRSGEAGRRRRENGRTRLCRGGSSVALRQGGPREHPQGPGFAKRLRLE